MLHVITRDEEALAEIYGLAEGADLPEDFRLDR